MAEPPPDPPSRPVQQINHDQLKNRAAPAFDDAAGALREVLALATGQLGVIGSWPTNEEVDRAFVEWLKPKRDEMTKLIGQFAEVYEDLGDGLRAVSQNVKTVDWGIADDMKLEDMPFYPDIATGGNGKGN